MIETPWKAVLSICSEATEVVLVAPYIKTDALSKVLEKIQDEASLKCVTRWTPLDIQMGASDLECRTIVNTQGGSFRLCNRLHAKYYRFDEQVLIGSANLTASGLSFAHSGNLEILCGPSSTFDWQAFESELQRQSRDVSDEDFQLWEQCSVEEVLQLQTGIETAGRSLDQWKPQTRRLEYLWLLYCGNDSQITSNEQRELAQLDLAVLAVPEGLSFEKFNGWIRSSLRASPFMDTLKELSKKDQETVWDVIAKEWRVNKSVAARWTSTAHNWLRYFEREAGEFQIE